MRKKPLLPKSIVNEQTRQMAQATDYKKYLVEALGHLTVAERAEIEASYIRVYINVK